MQSRAEQGWAVLKGYHLMQCVWSFEPVGPVIVCMDCVCVHGLCLCALIDEISLAA